jgi:hypothetical protein
MTQSVEPRLVADGVNSPALVAGINRRRDRQLCAFPLICINTCLPTMKPLRGLASSATATFASDKQMR